MTTTASTSLSPLSTFYKEKKRKIEKKKFEKKKRKMIKKNNMSGRQSNKNKMKRGGN